MIKFTYEQIIWLTGNDVLNNGRQLFAKEYPLDTAYKMGVLYDNLLGFHKEVIAPKISEFYKQYGSYDVKKGVWKVYPIKEKEFDKVLEDYVKTEVDFNFEKIKMEEIAMLLWTPNEVNILRLSGLAEELNFG